MRWRFGNGALRSFLITFDRDDLDEKEDMLWFDLTSELRFVLKFFYAKVELELLCESLFYEFIFLAD